MKVVITVLSLAALVYKVHSQAVELVNTNLFSSVYPSRPIQTIPSYPEVSIAYPPQYLPPSYPVNLPPSVEIVQQNIDIFSSEPTVNFPVEVPLNFPFLPRPFVPIPSLPVPTVGCPSLPVPTVSLPPLPIPYPVVAPTPIPIYQNTVEDNKLANSLANVLQLLVASKAIESSNKPNCPCVQEIVPVCSPQIEVVAPIPSCVETIIAPFPPAFGFEVVNQIPLSGAYGTEYVVTSVVDRVQPLYSPGLLPGNVYLSPSSVPTLSFSAVY